jgi:hypothetical protein
MNSLFNTTTTPAVPKPASFPPTTNAASFVSSLTDAYITTTDSDGSDTPSTKYDFRNNHINKIVSLAIEKSKQLCLARFVNSNMYNDNDNASIYTTYIDKTNVVSIYNWLNTQPNNKFTHLRLYVEDFIKKNIYDCEVMAFELSDEHREKFMIMVGASAKKIELQKLNIKLIKILSQKRSLSSTAAGTNVYENKKQKISDIDISETNTFMPHPVGQNHNTPKL